LQPWSRITDFGSGPQMSNIFVANKGCKDTLTFQSPKEILDLSKLIEDLRNGNTNAKWSILSVVAIVSRNQEALLHPRHNLQIT
jgi:hypothetical protein